MRRPAPIAVLALAFLLAACASTAPPPPPDAARAVDEDAATAAMQLGHPSEAARSYAAALARARARDDGPAIAAAGTNLAIAELADNQVAAALADARDLQAELARRGTPAPPALDLVIATALYRQGDLAGSEAMAKRVASGPDEAVALRGRFLLGLIAARRHGSAGLLAAVQVLGAHQDPTSSADATELRARLALARGETAAAEQGALRAVTLRAALHDDRGVARGLALAGDAALAAGARAGAADFYLRAGRDAATGGDAVLARQWLGAAKSLAADPRVTRDAGEALAKLGP